MSYYLFTELKSKKMNFLAEELEELEKGKNNGNGIQAVKTLIYFLKKGDYEKACAVANNEWDKISAYEDISNFIIENRMFVPIKFD